MQIQLPDDPTLASRASAAGFESVEDYVRELLARDAVQADTEPGPARRRMPHEQWKREFRKLLDTVQSTNPDFDDSRESIYPVR